MSRLGGIMGIGKEAMQTSQTHLQTTSHNIANSTTEGYTRQRVEQVARTPISYGNLRIGQGAKTVNVKRITDDFLTKQIQIENNKMGTVEGRNNGLARVEQIYNESINKGLNQFLAKFFNAFREFANNPESPATRALVKENAKLMTEDFHRIHGNLLDIQRDLDNTIAAQVDQVNSYTREIGDLNQKIVQVEITGHRANDERDRRDLVVRKLGELVNIRWAEGDLGQIAVTAGNTALLVSGSEFNELHCRRTPGDEVKREGSFDIYFQNAPPYGSEFKVTREFTGGQIGGALDVRDIVINDLHKKMDHIAYTVSDAVNSVHEQGYDRYNNTGKLFFKPIAEEHNAAYNIHIEESILKDSAHIAHGLLKDAPGDNRIANAIAAIQNEQLFANGTATIDEYYNGIVGEFGTLTHRNVELADHQKHIVSQLNNLRESISGVSLDEETADMVKFQKTFDASAKLIKIADEMMETVINIRR